MFHLTLNLHLLCKPSNLDNPFWLKTTFRYLYIIYILIYLNISIIQIYDWLPEIISFLLHYNFCVKPKHLSKQPS